MTARFTVLSVHLMLGENDRNRPVQIAGAFDRIQSPEAARACGRQIGEVVSDELERRLRYGEVLGDPA